MHMQGVKTAGTGIMALAAMLAVASPATAQQSAPADASAHDVAVAIVDVGSNKLYSKDANVRFVDLTPALKPGYSHASGRVGDVDHGDIVAQAFVREYRRLDPSARITIYTINPFVTKGFAGTGSMMFSRSAIRESMPRLKEAGVRTVVTTFGVSDQKAGESILKEFQDAGIVVFASAPNSKDDEGIWPAASPASIAVADGDRNSEFYKAKGWSKWVDFVASGIEHDGTMDGQGASFATPKVAAYGAYHVARNPGAGPDEVRQAIAASSIRTRINGIEVTRVGGDDMAARFRGAEVSPGSRSKGVAVANTDTGALMTRAGLGSGQDR